MKESEFQRRFKRRLKEEFPGCFVMKQDPKQIQGIPDLVVFYKDKYAMFEMKVGAKAHRQPNQTNYIDGYPGFPGFKEWTYASFVSPENEEEVIAGLKGWFNE